MLRLRRTLATAAAAPYLTRADAVQPAYDAIVVGGGHNGLTSAAYLARAGKRVLVLERRHVVGGAAVTEEIVPGFKFSRASYLLSLLRPTIVETLNLKEHGLKAYTRDTSSFTPTLDGRYLLMGRDAERTRSEIAKFSQRDADVFEEYEATLASYVSLIELVLDAAPLGAHDIRKMLTPAAGLGTLLRAYGIAGKLKGAVRDLPRTAEIFTAPASKLLDSWFESPLLKATLSTDAVIGAMTSPYVPGSGYVLLHHVMGEINGIRGAWAYAEGGMGAVSAAIARSAASSGAHIVTDAPVKRILVEHGSIAGVELKDSTKIAAPVVLSNATPQVTFVHLLGKEHLTAEFMRGVQSINYDSATMKINVAVNALPNFKALPNTPGSTAPQPHHQATAHFEESMDEIHRAYLDAVAGRASERPMIEMCVPSSLDPTIAPPGKHVVSLFVQYAPYRLKEGSWEDPSFKERYADKVFKIIDQYAPNFSASVVGRDVLSPLDLERIFGLTGGNIFHGSMSLDQLYFMRPTRDSSQYATPVRGLYLCGSGAHPGGGVMGAAGRNAALRVIDDIDSGFARWKEAYAT